MEECLIYLSSITWQFLSFFYWMVFDFFYWYWKRCIGATYLNACQTINRTYPLYEHVLSRVLKMCGLPNRIVNDILLRIFLVFQVQFHISNANLSFFFFSLIQYCLLHLHMSYTIITFYTIFKLHQLALLTRHILQYSYTSQI